MVFRLAADPRSATQGAALDQTTDWPWLQQIAWEEGAIGALKEHLRRCTPGHTPLEFERRVACLALERTMRMRILEERFAKSLALLTSAGIHVALLKGAALAATLYGSFDARPMKDIDILVDPARAEEAKQLMLGSGWQRDHELPDDSVYTTHHHLAPLIDALGSRSRLEIHRTLLPIGHPFALSMSDLWRAMRPADVDGSRVFVLDPNHHALHIAIHFAWSHTMRAGAWHAFRDLGAMDRAGMIDWPAFVRRATSARASTCCYWTLKLARTMTGLPVPEHVLVALAPPVGRSLLNRLERHFVNVLVRRDSTHLSPRLDRALWSLAVQPRQQGHGNARPWTVSAELTAARLRHDPPSPRDRIVRHAVRVARCSIYIAGLL